MVTTNYKLCLLPLNSAGSLGVSKCHILQLSMARAAGMFFPRGNLNKGQGLHILRVGSIELNSELQGVTFTTSQTICTQRSLASFKKWLLNCGLWFLGSLRIIRLSYGYQVERAFQM